MNCLILDDEPFATDLIESYVNQIPNLNTIRALNNPLEALPIIESGNIDLLLLDIHMPHLTGFDVLSKLDKKPLVILISAHPEYALIGFQWDVVDYLLKPVSFEEFNRAISKAFKRKETELPSKTVSGTNSFFVRGEHKIMKVDVSSILFIESYREYAHLHTQDGKNVFRKSLTSLENMLDSNSFLRVHRSYIIALDKIDSIANNMIYIKEHEIPIGKNYREALFEQINLI